MNPEPSPRYGPFWSLLFILFLCATSGFSIAQTSPSPVKNAEPRVSWQNLAIDLNGVQVALDSGFAVSANRLELAPGQVSGKATSKTLTTPTSFKSLAVKWSSEYSLDDGSLSVRIRASRDGKSWSAWQQISVDGHMTGQRAGSYSSNLVFFNERMSHLQYHINLANGSRSRPVVLSDLSFFLIDPKGVTDQPPSPKADKGATVQAISRPAVVSRTSWGCPEGQNSPNWTPQYTEVTHFIVHHTATSNSSQDWAGVVQSIWAYHTIDRGWGDIGYNYLVDPDGVIYEGRAGGDNAIGAHFSCRNANTMGVALLGTYTSTAPSDAAMSSLEHVLAWKSATDSISPTGVTYHPGTGLDLFNISGHRDGNDAYPHSACSTTACPGDTAYALLPTIRTHVDELAVDYGFEMNAGLNDAWYYPETDGQGFFITVFPEMGRVVASWFTYDTVLPGAGDTAVLGDPGLRWFNASGKYDGNQAVMTIKWTGGGLFDTSTEIVRAVDGTMTLTFDNCASGTVEYDIPSLSLAGIVPIQRVAGDNIALCEALAEQPADEEENNLQGVAGSKVESSTTPEEGGETILVTEMNAGLNDAWYYPETDGQGFFITVLPEMGRVVASWFTYDTFLPGADDHAILGDPGHRWFNASGKYTGNQAVMTMKWTSGGLFDTPAEIVRTVDGTMTLTFENCNSGTIEYDIPSLTLGGTVPIQRIAGDNIALCEAFAEQEAVR